MKKQGIALWRAATIGKARLVGGQHRRLFHLLRSQDQLGVGIRPKYWDLFEDCCVSPFMVANMFEFMTNDEMRVSGMTDWDESSPARIFERVLHLIQYVTRPINLYEGWLISNCFFGKPEPT